MGISKKILERNKSAKIIAVEPLEMPLLTSNKIIRKHKIEGIADEFVPSLINKKIINKITKISDNDAINMCKKFSKDLGLGIGISSSANFLASALEKENGYVTIFADSNKKYLSVLEQENKLNDKFISNNIELLNIEYVL